MHGAYVFNMFTTIAASGVKGKLNTSGLSENIKQI